MIAQVHTDDNLNLHAAAHISYFREKALDAFIRGLDKTLSVLLKSTNPKTLSQAYNFCTDYYNMDMRSAPFRNELGGQPTPKPRDLPAVPKPQLPPPLPPRRFLTNPFQNYTQQPRIFPNPFKFNPSNPFLQTPRNLPSRNPFHSNLPSRNPFHSNHFGSAHPPQRAMPPPEPMEVDHSLRSRNVNYGNRPPINLKRPFPPSQQYPQNVKRQAYPLENTYPDTDNDVTHYYDDNGYRDDYDYNGLYYDTDQYDSHFQPTQDAEQYVADVNEPEPSTSDGANFLEWQARW